MRFRIQDLEKDVIFFSKCDNLFFALTPFCNLSPKRGRTCKSERSFFNNLTIMSGSRAPRPYRTLDQQLENVANYLWHARNYNCPLKTNDIYAQNDLVDIVSNVIIHDFRNARVGNGANSSIGIHLSLRQNPQYS